MSQFHSFRTISTRLNRTKREYLATARSLVGMVYPFTTLKCILQMWRNGNLEEAPPPDDEDLEEPEGDEEGEPENRFSSEDIYDKQAFNLSRSKHNSHSPFRFITSIEVHYSSLAVTNLFECHSELEDYLKGRGDDTLISAVRLQLLTPHPRPPTHITQKQMSRAATSIRSTHCHNIKWNIFQYLRPSDSTELNVPITPNLKKEERGLKDKGTTHFLIPRSCLNDFEKHPDR